MTKYKVKIKICGNIAYHGSYLKNNQILDEYDIELLNLVEQKLVKVEKISVEEKNKKKKKYSDSSISELV